jgi:CopG family transcriptional regulator, nickel-responsive regulator
MQRFTISLEDRLATEFDELIRRKGYGNRSEALRDMLRGTIEKSRVARGEALHAVGCLSYVYNHHERDLAERLTALAHEHHDLVVSATHVHLDHETCIETVILRGRTADVHAFADAVIAERGVRHGGLNLVPVDVGAAPHRHVHARPKS